MADPEGMISFHTKSENAIDKQIQQLLDKGKNVLIHPPSIHQQPCPFDLVLNLKFLHELF